MPGSGSSWPCIAFAIARGREGELDVRGFEMRRGFPEAVDLRRREPENALSADAPFGDLGGKSQAAAALVDRVDVLHAHRKARRVVIAQVLADAGQRVAHLDAERLEQRGRADAGQLQQLRRIERAARKDDFAARPHLDRRAIAPALAIAHADRALALEHQPGRVRARAHGQVRPLHRGMQERARRAHAAAVLDRALRVIDAELAFAVVVRVARNAEARPRPR